MNRIPGRAARQRHIDRVGERATIRTDRRRGNHRRGDHQVQGVGDRAIHCNPQALSGRIHRRKIINARSGQAGADGDAGRQLVHSIAIDDKDRMIQRMTHPGCERGIDRIGDCGGDFPSRERRIKTGGAIGDGPVHGIAHSRWPGGFHGANGGEKGRVGDILHLDDLLSDRAIGVAAAERSSVATGVCSKDDKDGISHEGTIGRVAHTFIAGVGCVADRVGGMLGIIGDGRVRRARSTILKTVETADSSPIGTPSETLTLNGDAGPGPDWILRKYLIGPRIVRNHRAACDRHSPVVLVPGVDPQVVDLVLVVVEPLAIHALI